MLLAASWIAWASGKDLLYTSSKKILSIKINSILNKCLFLHEHFFNVHLATSVLTTVIRSFWEVWFCFRRDIHRKKWCIITFFCVRFVVQWSHKYCIIGGEFCCFFKFTSGSQGAHFIVNLLKFCYTYNRLFNQKVSSCKFNTNAEMVMLRSSSV